MKSLDELAKRRQELEDELRDIAILMRTHREREERRQQERLVRNFRLKKDHIKLLKRMEFVYFGKGDLVSIGVEGKRPFGNSSVYRDMAQILGWKFDEEEDLTQRQCDRLERLMKELPLALNRILKKYRWNQS